jgi:YVTN family beta-propeller protein
MNSFTKNNTVSKFVKLTNSGFPGIFFTLLCAIFMISSCDNKDDFGEINTQGSKYNAGAGVFILNEGNFGQGNGSLSFLRFDSSKIENDIFFQTNNRPLGDVPFSMSIIGENAWIAVNNSAKIEIVALKDLSQVATIEGFLSPRFILEVAENKAYVSDLYGDEISVLDTKNYSISGKISLGYSSEQMVLANNLVFVAFWSNYAFPAFENNKVFIINPANDQLTDSIEVGKEPNSMVVDKNMKVWVLCSGGFMNEEIPTLQQINPETLEVEEIFAFGNIQSSPSSLCINGTLDTLFFISSGIFRMSITENKVPEQPFIPEQEHLYYQIAVDPKTSDIYATDAIDYQQNGLILRYKPDGTFIDFHHAGIIPGQMIFR